MHIACQAFRAATDGPIPSAGPDAGRPVVVAMLLLFWLPSALFAWQTLTAAPRAGLRSGNGTAHALAMAELGALVVVVAFAVGHGATVAWPILRGAQLESDVRPALRAALSGTSFGMPVLAAAYIFAVGATAFSAARQVFHAMARRPALARRASVVFGVVSCALGVYAVIRVASGPLLPF